MIRPYLLLACLLCFLTLHGQKTTHDLAYYLEEAKANSPLLRDYHNQREIGQMELHRLKAFYEHYRMEVTGDYLFVPIIDKEGRKASFCLNAQDATDYYGYDLGESSGHLHAGVTWTQPLLGRSSYKVMKEQTDIQDAILRHDICLEGHRLERSVTEQYLLCLLDRAQIAFADSVDSLLGMRAKAVGRLVKAGQAKRSDLHLLFIEREANREIRLSILQSYHTHLIDLNLLCGIDDTSTVELRDTDIRYALPDRDGKSIFTYQYQLDSLAEKASLRSFDLQYRPRLDLFVNGGLQVGDFAQWQRHFGWSAGLTFSWTIFDGKQRRWREQQSRIRQQTIRAYRENTVRQRRMKLEQCLSELEKYDDRLRCLDVRLREYESVLSDYAREMQAGQVSVLDYITVLRNRMQVCRDRMLLRTNRKIIIATYNYWNH